MTVVNRSSGVSDVLTGVVVDDAASCTGRRAVLLAHVAVYTS